MPHLFHINKSNIPTITLCYPVLPSLYTLQRTTEIIEIEYETIMLYLENTKVNLRDVEKLLADDQLDLLVKGYKVIAEVEGIDIDSIYKCICYIRENLPIKG